MIGGIDISYAVTADVEAVRVMLRVTRAHWQTSVVEMDEDGRVLSIPEAYRLRWSIPCEFFLYENREALRQWTEHGRTDENAERMVYVIVQPDGIYFVVDAERSSSHALVLAIIDALNHHRNVSFRTNLRKAA